MVTKETPDCRPPSLEMPSSHHISLEQKSQGLIMPLERQELKKKDPYMGIGTNQPLLKLILVVNFDMATTIYMATDMVPSSGNDFER